MHIVQRECVSKKLNELPQATYIVTHLNIVSDFILSTSHANNTFVSGRSRVTNWIKKSNKRIQQQGFGQKKKGTQSCCWGSASTSAAFWLRSSLISGSADPSLSFLGERDAERDLDLDF